MSNTKRTLGLIPARGGSKRVSRKNIREFNGKPLIAHSIEQANSASSVDKTVVSTDDEEISAVAKDYGADVPFERPEELATDTATNTEVVSHAINWFEKEEEKFDLVCMLLPTNPFRAVSDINTATSQLVDSDTQSVIGVVEYDISPAFALEIKEGGLVEPLLEEKYFTSKTRTQETPDYVHPNGSLYAAKIDAFRENNSFYTKKTVAHKMPPERSFDIDTERDLTIARAIIAEKENSTNMVSDT
jgi:pseudaminic acid cytidylyltransferase